MSIVLRPTVSESDILKGGVSIAIERGYIDSMVWCRHGIEIILTLRSWGVFRLSTEDYSLQPLMVEVKGETRPSSWLRPVLSDDSTVLYLLGLGRIVTVTRVEAGWEETNISYTAGLVRGAEYVFNQFLGLLLPDDRRRGLSCFSLPIGSTDFSPKLVTDRQDLTMPRGLIGDPVWWELGSTIIFCGVAGISRKNYILNIRSGYVAEAGDVALGDSIFTYCSRSLLSERIIGISQRTAVSGHLATKIVVINVATGGIVRELSLPYSPVEYLVSISPGGDMIAVVDDTFRLHLLSLS